MLETLLERESENRRVVGMGGAGKTQIALEYYKQVWKSREFRHIFWVDATSLESIQRSYYKIASCLDGGVETA